MNAAELVQNLLNRLAVEERESRRRNGLPTDHVLDFAEFPVRFSQQLIVDLNTATAEALRQYPANPSLRLIRAFILVLSGQYAAADVEMATYQKLNPSDLMGQMRFDSLPPASHSSGLPPLRGEWPRRPSFFIACDKKYLHVFAAPLLRSLAAQSPGAPIHIHMMDADAEEWRRFAPLNLDITSSSENAATFTALHGIKPENYYNTARLLRFAEAASQSEHTLCTLDADGLVVRDPIRLLKNGIGLRVRAGRLEPVHHFSACVVTLKNDPTGYANAIVSILRSLMEKPFWGADQYALFAAWLHCHPQLKLYGPETATVDGASTDGILAFTAGSAKGRLMTDNTPYAALFRHYASTPTPAT